MRATDGDRAEDETRFPRASQTPFAPGSPGEDLSKQILPMKAREVPAAQRTRLRMKERKSQLSFRAAQVPAPLRIHFCCKERLARDLPVTAREGLGLTDWSRGILPERVGRVDKVRAEDVAEPGEGLAAVALVDRAEEEREAAECLAERPVAEERAVEAECSGGAED